MKIYPIKNYENIVCSTLEGYSLTRHARLYESDKLVGFFTKKYNFFSITLVWFFIIEVKINKVKNIIVVIIIFGLNIYTL